MFNRKSALVGSGALLGLIMTVASVSAWPNYESSVTFSGPVSLPGVTLGSGTYVFQLASPNSDTGLIRVTNKERNVVYLGFTQQINRPAGLKPSEEISLRETAGGVPPSIKAWFPAGDSTGHQFIYNR